jgi:hypothetical protein
MLAPVQRRTSSLTELRRAELGKHSLKRTKRLPFCATFGKMVTYPAEFVETVRNDSEEPFTIPKIQRVISVADTLTQAEFREAPHRSMKNAGIPEGVVMELIGHESEAMSHHYTHAGNEALESVAALPVI